MAKMSNEIKRKILFELCQFKEELNFNAPLVQRIIEERLKYIPHKRLYKFRSCSINNFKTLEENCIWMAPASSFNDLFDNTINIDLAQNRQEVEEWLYNNFPVFCFDLAKSLCEHNGYTVPFTHNDFIEYVNTCLDKQGQPIIEKEQDFIKSRANSDDLEIINGLFELLKKLRDNFAETEDQMVDTLQRAINDTRTHMRDATLVYCMTERYDNPTLWEVYANNYSGFCIEYYFGDFFKKAFDDYKNLSYIFPMSYRKNKPCFNMVPFMDQACRQVLYKESHHERNLDSDVELNMHLLCKGKDYEFEHEWRFSINNKSNNRQYFPYVNAIYAGKDIKPGNLKRLRSIAKKLGVPVYQQTLNKFNNGFDYISIKL